MIDGDSLQIRKTDEGTEIVFITVIVRESELMRAVRKIIKMYNASFNEVYKE